MRESKASHKRLKSGRWSHLVTSYTFFFAGILCQIFVLLLLSVWKEFSEMTGSRYESVADMAAIVLVILLLIVWSMRWTYPMAIEEPIIIIVIWMILSSRINQSHCFCCHSNRPVSSSGLALGAVPGVAAAVAPPPQEEGLDGGDDGGAVAVKAHHAPGHGHDDLMLDAWQLLVSECDLESFNFLYSLMCVLLVLVALCTELRNYYVSLLFRLATALLLAILLILLVVSPCLCSKFDMSQSLILLTRVTLFLALGWINKYRRATERSVTRDYNEVVVAATETLTLMNTELPAHLGQDKASTPRALFLYFSRLVRFLADQSEAERNGGTRPHAKKHRQKKQRGRDDDDDLPLGRVEMDDADDADRAAEEDEDERQLARFKRHRDQSRSQLASAAADSGAEVENLGETMTDIMVHLYNLSVRYRRNYVSGVVYWKHRGHSKHLLHLIDLAYVIWILIVCPQWLLLVPLELAWLLYCISLNTAELAETRKFVALQSAVMAKSAHFAISIT